MSEAKGLNKPVKLKADLAKLLGETSLPRTEITQRLWKHIKDNGLQTSKVGGKKEGKGKNIVVDEALLTIMKNTNSTSKSGKVTDLRAVKVGDTVDMMVLASVVGANIE